MRAFVAVPLSTAVSEAAFRLLPDLPALRRVRPDLMHVTLAFLGDVDPGRIAGVADAVSAAARGWRSFEVGLDHLGRFPEAGAPRVIWLGIGPGRDALVAFGRAVRRELALRDVAFDDKPLQAHVTLARVRESAGRDELRSIGHVLDGIAVVPLTAHVEEVVVLESVIGAGGPRYTRRAATDLDGVEGKR